MSDEIAVMAVRELAARCAALRARVELLAQTVVGLQAELATIRAMTRELTFIRMRPRKPKYGRIP